jgi:hypothetical protein
LNVKDSRLEQVIGVRGARLQCTTFSPDGEYAAVGTTDHVLQLRAKDLSIKVRVLPLTSDEKPGEALTLAITPGFDDDAKSIDPGSLQSNRQLQNGCGAKTCTHAAAGKNLFRPASKRGCRLDAGVSTAVYGATRARRRSWSISVRFRVSPHL